MTGAGDRCPRSPGTLCHMRSDLAELRRNGAPCAPSHRSEEFSRTVWCATQSAANASHARFSLFSAHYQGKRPVSEPSKVGFSPFTPEKSDKWDGFGARQNRELVMAITGRRRGANRVAQPVTAAQVATTHPALRTRAGLQLRRCLSRLAA